MRIHTSPSIQITEIDKSQYSPAMTGTVVYIQGFSSKGEVYKPTDITSRTAFVTIFGEPQTEAERYAYAAVCECLNNQGKCVFARLPYDNESFEKMVGFQYSVSDMKQISELLTNTSDALSVIADKLSSADADIGQYCEITSKKQPIMYDLSTINEYRTHETNVPADTFLVVDTTGATYSKIQEDSRKGQKRELIGIVPIVTTAANALYAQSMISLDDHDAWRLETISGDMLVALSGNDLSATDKCIRGLLKSDMVKRINTKDFYAKQMCKFDTVTICTSSYISTITSERTPITLDDDNIANWKTPVSAFINGTTLSNNGYAYEELTDYVKIYSGLYGLIADEYKSKLIAPTSEELDEVTSDKLKTYIKTASEVYSEHNLISTAESVSEWYQVIEDDLKPLCIDITSYISVYNSLTASGKPLWTSVSSYVNPATIKEVIDDDDNVTSAATLLSASELSKAEWHGVDGDDSLPDTICLDANNYFSTIQPASDGDGFDPEHLKDIGVVVYKMYLDAAEGNKISYEPVEAYCGSLYKDDKDPNTGVTKFIDTIINSQSQYINFFSNCFSSKSRKSKYLKDVDILLMQPSTGVTLGMYESMTKKDISISKSIYDGMNKAFDKASDINERDIDIVCDAGLANIASYMKAIYGDKGEYDLTVTDDLGNSMLGLWKAVDPTSAPVKTWKTVEQKFDNFCKNMRKDCMFIADGLRPLVLQGQKKIIRASKPANTLDKNVIPYIKCITGLNTSYGAGYMDWFEQADDYTGDFFWCPPSIKAMGVYVNTDVNFNYWDAPAGLNRGIIAATDVAFSPIASQADLIYDKNWNYAVNYPNDGIVLEGQKTFQVKPSALDRVNVRRLCLRLERAVGKVLRYFLYEGNTAYVRQRVVDAITPYFRSAQVGGGLYGYKIVCDETNNTATTIDQNELHISIGIKPVKTIEYIMVDFIIGSTGASWSELGL